MRKLDAGSTPSLLASDSGSTAVWGSTRTYPWPQSCLCLPGLNALSNDDDNDNQSQLKLNEGVPKIIAKKLDEDQKKVFNRWKIPFRHSGCEDFLNFQLVFW